MNKHGQNGIIYTKIKHVVSGRCWHFDTKDKFDVLCQLLGKKHFGGNSMSPTQAW
jgi:hypothetical protein